MFKKIIRSGFFAGIIMLLAGLLTSQLFVLYDRSLKMEYENASLFRSWSDPLMMGYFVHPFVLGFILSWLWLKTRVLFSGEAQWKNGVNFGLTYWLITVPGMIISYCTFPISFLMVLSWSVGILIQALLAGLLFSKLDPY